MTADAFSLPWLLQTPDSFRSEIRSLKDAPLNESVLRGIANTDMDINQLASFSKLVTKRAHDIASMSFAEFRLGIVASHTMDYATAALPAVGLRHGVLISSHLADYGQAAQELLDANSNLARANLDGVLIAFDPATLGLDQPRYADHSEAVKGALDYVESLRKGVRDVIGTAPILQTLPLPVDPVFGSYEAQMPGAPRSMVESFNKGLIAMAAQHGDLLLDAAHLANQIGLSNWHDARQWHAAKMPFAMDAVPLYADHIARLIGAIRGKARKCLVLDLDNTVWGGVIGDDGMNGIKLGQGSAIGESHSRIQTYAHSLRQRGIVLAVCSKNEEVNAREPFQDHPEMVLKEDHISAFVANWTDKATNMKSIAQMLNIGTDALVFLDDNPAERARVREELPEVAVPEVGDEPADYVPLLARAGYFDTTSFTEDDRKRADMYHANAQRAQVLESVGNLDEYLEGLEMVASFKPFDDLGRTRITQLINKTNQFNLTTKRYTEAQVAEFQSSNSKHCLQIRLEDRFGDNGMISVVMFDKGAETWACDTWLMSCRVLGRRVEETTLAQVAEAAQKAGASALTGHYIPTKKNGLVAEHFAKLGFEKTGETAQGATDWRLDLASYKAPAFSMKIVT